MSHHDYQKSREIAAEEYPFYAIIMAAMRQADDFNLAKLKSVFPDTWEELKERYHGPGGYTKAEWEECTSRFGRGTQVAYIPDHVPEGDLSHRDVEFGFVMEVSPEMGSALCRYWRKSDPRNYLRTVANSEWTPVVNLVPHGTVQQSEVDRLIGLIGRDELTCENCFYNIEKLIDQEDNKND